MLAWLWRSVSRCESQHAAHRSVSFFKKPADSHEQSFLLSGVYRRDEGHPEACNGAHDVMCGWGEKCVCDFVNVVPSSSEIKW